MTRNRKPDPLSGERQIQNNPKNRICRQKLYNNYKHAHLLNKDKNHEHGKKRIRQHKKEL